MANKNTVDTAQKGQTTTKNNIPTGKVKTLANATERRKAREEQFRNFRINALKRRCKRMGFDEAKTEGYVKKLIEQLNTPKEYTILVQIYTEYPRKKLKDGEIFKPQIDVFIEDLGKAKINYNFRGSNYVYLSGNQDILAKIREIAPPKAKIYPYAKKMESVLKDVERPPQEKKPTNNTAAVKAANKQKKKELHRCTHKKGKGKSIAKQQRKISLSARKKLRKATIIQLKAKKSSTGSKKASTNLKKAA